MGLQFNFALAANGRRQAKPVVWAERVSGFAPEAIAAGTEIELAALNFCSLLFQDKSERKVIQKPKPTAKGKLITQAYNKPKKSRFIHSNPLLPFPADVQTNTGGWEATEPASIATHGGNQLLSLHFFFRKPRRDPFGKSTPDNTNSNKSKICGVVNRGRLR